MRAQVYNYTIREGSVETKTQEEELSKKLQPPDDRSGPDVQRLKIHRTTGVPAPEPNERTSDTTGRPATGRPVWTRNPLHQHPSQNERMTGPSGRPAAHEPPDDRSPADVRYLAVSSCRLRPMYPFTYLFVALDYIYSSTSTI